MPSLIRNKVSGGKTLMKHVTPTLSKFVIGNQEMFQYSSHFTAFSEEFGMWTVDHGGSVNCFGIDETNVVLWLTWYQL